MGQGPLLSLEGDPFFILHLLKGFFGKPLKIIKNTDGVRMRDIVVRFCNPVHELKGFLQLKVFTVISETDLSK